MIKTAIPIRDKTGREIMVGDVVKVLHFIGDNRRRHYMHKQVLRHSTRGKAERGNVSPCLFVSHLNLKEGDGYHLPLDGSYMENYEIVSSVKADWRSRPRIRRASDKDAMSMQTSNT